jgi:hypothetical protein
MLKCQELLFDPFSLACSLIAALSPCYVGCLSTDFIARNFDAVRYVDPNNALDVRWEL